MTITVGTKLVLFGFFIGFMAGFSVCLILRPTEKAD